MTRGIRRFRTAPWAARRPRAQCLLAGLLLLLLSPATWAIGFGELMSQSPLNRPLDVVFPVILDSPGGDISQLPTVSIANDAVYTELGARRPDLLDSVLITLEPAGARVLVHIRTEQRILEPYLPLIVQVALPTGVLRHRYDLLLDPVPSNGGNAATEPEVAIVTTSPNPIAAAPAGVASPGANLKPLPTTDGPAHPAGLQQHASRKQAHAESAPAAMVPACIAPGAMSPAPAQSPRLFRLDSGLHTEITPVPAQIAQIPSATKPAPDVAIPPPAASGTATPVVAASSDAAAQSPPEATTAIPPTAATAAMVPDANEKPSRLSWLDIFVIALLLGSAWYIWRSGALDSLRVSRLRAAADADEHGLTKQYVSMTDVHAGVDGRKSGPIPTATARDGNGVGHSGPAAATSGHPGTDYIPYVAPSSEEMKPVARPPQRYEGIEVIDASGFYDDIALLLEHTLEREPRRMDLYQKLIEVYISAGKPEQALRIKQQLQGLRNGPAAAGINNEEWQRVLQQADELLSRESAGLNTDAADEVAVASSGGPHWNRYYEGPEFESLPDHLAPVREAYAAFRRDAVLQQTLTELINEEVGRPTPLQQALQFSNNIGGAQIYFKREDLRLAESERIINLIGQMLLMRSMGKLGVVTAAADNKGFSAVVSAAKALDMPSTVFMPHGCIEALPPDLVKLAQKHHVDYLSGADPRDVRRDALACWLAHPDRLGYITGLRAGPDPFPTIVMDFIAVVGHETRRQLLRYTKQDPAVIVSSALGGFTSIGFVKPYLDKSGVRIIMTDPPPGFVPGASAAAATPAAAGYELALREQRWLHASGRVEYLEVDRERARQARLDCDRVEEFMPKPGDAAAIGMGLEIARTLPATESVIILLSAFGPP